MVLEMRIHHVPAKIKEREWQIQAKRHRQTYKYINGEIPPIMEAIDMYVVCSTLSLWTKNQACCFQKQLSSMEHCDQAGHF